MEHAAPTSAAEWESRFLSREDEDEAETTETLTDEPESVTEEPAEESAPAPDDDETPQPDDATTADQAEVGSAEKPAPETPQSTAATPKIETRPLRVRVDGQDIDVPDAIETNDGRIVMTRDAFNRVLQPRLTDRRALHERHQKELAAARAQADPEKNPVVLRAKILVEEFDKLQDAGLLQVDPDELEKLQLRVDNEILRRGIKQEPEAAADEPSETEVAETRTLFETGLGHALDTLLAHDLYKDLGLSKDHLYKLVRPRWQEWARVADALDPNGFEEGKKYIDMAAVRALVDELAEPIRNERKRLSDVAAARKKNEAALGGGNAPVAVTTAGSQAVGGRKKAPPKSKEEWLERLNEPD